MLETLYTVKQAAQALGVCSTTVNRFINGADGREKLPAQKIGRAWRIKEKDLQDFINRNKNC